MDALNQFIADLKTDFDFWLKDTPDVGKIHRGFDKALDEVWTDVLADLDQLTDRPLWITGHSLGGALATLAAARYKKTQAVYTYGSPRVGDGEFKRRFHTPAFRFVHHKDVVTKVPPRPYHHVGQLYRLDAQGRLALGAQAKKTFFKILGEKMAGMISGFRTPKMSSEAAIPEGLKNHTPLLYALHIWNNLVAEH
jgi:pimeloyl-ACP methyl ester carboxylesterase